MPDLQVGDVVRTNVPMNANIHGLEVPIVDIHPNGMLLVEFAPHWLGGHSGGDTVRTTSGLWLYESQLELVSIKPFYLVTVGKDGVESNIADARTYNTGKEAGVAAKEWSVKLGCKVQPRRVAAADPSAWKEREKKRLTDGTYAPLPDTWVLPPIPDHFLHVSKKDPSKVCFTETPEKGTLDRQTVIRPGAYLQRFYPDLHEEERKRYIAMVDKANGYGIATTPAGIVEVYQNGPESCMSGDVDDDYSSDDHPVEVYGNSDLALAYLGPIDGASARVLIWPERKVYGRIYGDAARLKGVLEDDGFKSGNFKGARIQAIKQNCGGYLVPYVDGAQHLSLTEDGRWLIIDGPTTGVCLAADCTDGVSESIDICPKTGRYMTEDNRIWIGSEGEYWHEDSIGEYAVRAENDDDYHPINECVLLANGDYVTERYFDRNGFVYKGENYLDSEGTAIRNGTMVPDDELDDECQRCEGNDEYYFNAEGREIDGYWYSDAFLATSEGQEVLAEAQGQKAA